MRVLFPAIVAAFALTCATSPASSHTPDGKPPAEESESEEATADRVVAATAADLRPGAEIRDVEGGLVGRIQTTERDSAIITTGRTPGPPTLVELREETGRIGHLHVEDRA